MRDAGADAPDQPDPARLRFTCLPGCTRCCDQRGFVYLTEDDVIRAAAYVGLPADEFEARYLYRTRNYRRLRKPPRSQCHFLVSGGCAIHPAKPTQCRTFPFWPDILENAGAWEATASYCPGIGVGDFVPLDAVKRAVEEMRAAD